jgi:hypothetical protein
MLDLLKKLQRKVVVGFVGGSDLSKQKEQIGKDGMLCKSILCLIISARLGRLFLF